MWLQFGCRLVQTILRMALGPLLVSICDPSSGGFSCSARDKGNLLSGFSLGYLSTQVLGGIAADRYGPRNLTSLALVVAGTTMSLTPLAAQWWGVDGLWLASVCLGLSQGPLFPTSIAHLSRWLPAEHRSWASAMLDSGITVGSLIALPCSAWLGASLGWEWAYRLYGAASLAFVGLLFWPRAADKPPGWATQETKPRDQPKESTLDALRLLFTQQAVWALLVSHAGFNFCVYFLNSWSPLFYDERLGLEPSQASLLLMAPHVGNLLVKTTLTKPIFATLQQRGWGLLGCRRFFSVGGFFGTALALSVLGSDSALDQMRAGGVAVGVSTCCFTVAMAIVGFHPSGFKANYLDLTRTHSGLLSGLGNTVASVGSWVGPLAVGNMLHQHHSWGMVFQAVCTVNVMCGLVFWRFSSVEPVDEPAKPLKQE